MPSFQISYQYREINIANPIRGSVSYRAAHVSAAIDIAYTSASYAQKAS